MRASGRSVLLLALLLCLRAADGSWHRRLRGQGRRITSLANVLRHERTQRDSDNFDDDRYSPAYRDYGTSKDLLSGKNANLKHLLHLQHIHHKTMMKKKRLNNRNEICLFKALRRCGNRLIAQFSSDSGFDNRCSTKEEFLDCMSGMQHGACHVKHVRHGPSRVLVEQYQQRLRRLLRSTRGCVIGVDLSTPEASR
ncbi:uncharacterized protein LOC119099076 [Pollicipes pollicipes]|uniref:uncharacterized protein LOC119098816 n=1 Tax=Pollicipes pollicipes TaxID=41117 RepID=UPI0018857A5B|nr:uncharacterized protein LOC119098816 [Pollicipes pollicipes]XP_037078024.1 uncharacterized protein LOC119099076 [Pollicipes pollicipes]